MVYTPEKIYEDFKRKQLDKDSAFDLFLSLIENSNNYDIRRKCIQRMAKIGTFNLKFFEMLENLLISDENEEIRNLAAIMIKNYFIGMALQPMKWAIRHESSYNCTITVIRALEKIDSQESKKALLQEIKNIKKSKFFDKEKQYRNKKFKSTISKLLKSRKIGKFTPKELAEILINYKTIAALKEKFYSVFYELDLKNGLISELDLSDVQYEVRGWKGEYRNNIKELSEITGLKNLEKLSSLNLENNQIKDVEELTSLKNLTHLYLSNNNIDDIINIEYLKNIPNLKYLDLCENQIAEKINPNDFKPELEIKLRRYLF